jgi:CzcA family heavy metal efflux pump
MTALVRLAVHHRWLTLLTALMLALAGAQAWLHLPIDAFPEIAPAQVSIVLKAPGMTPEEVEQRVVRPIETELLGIPRKRIVRSMSKYGIADITLDFEEGTDIYWARQQVSERYGALAADLPAGVDGGLAPISTPLGEMFIFSIESDTLSLAQRRRLLDWVIRPELRRITGVADVNSLGGEVQTIEVMPDAPRMAALGIRLDELSATLANNNSNDGAGRLSPGEESLIVRVEGAVSSLEDVRRMRIDSPRLKSKVFVEDIATVRQGALTRYGAVTLDGKQETVQGLVLGLRGANARLLVQEVSAQLKQLQTRMPPDVRLVVHYNRGDLTSRAIGTVTKALIEAGVLVCIVLTLFLGGVRPALVVALALPLSLLATFLLMQLTGLSANLMSLGGLAIALGMLVDAAVVVVENIESELQRQPDVGDAGLDSLITQAVSQVIRPVVVGMLIIAVVFLPLLTLQDLEGRLFSPVAQTIVMALGSALLISLTVVPAAARLVLRPGHVGANRVMTWAAATYITVRQRCWQHLNLMWGIAAGSLLLALGLYTQIGRIFIPTLDEGEILVQLNKVPSVSVDTSVAEDIRVANSLLQTVPEVAGIIARVGTDELGLDPMGFEDTDMFLRLKPQDQWRGDKQAVIDALRQTLDGFPGLIYSFTQPIEMRVSEMLTGTRGDVAIKLFGNNLDVLNKSARLVAEAIEAIPGATDVIAPRSEGLPYLTLTINRLHAGDAGLSVARIQQTLKAWIEGETVGYALQEGIRTPLVIKGPDSLRQQPAALRELPLVGEDGQIWRAGTLADIRQQEGPMLIRHENSLRLEVVQVSVNGRDLSGFVDEARAIVSQLGLPPDIQVIWGGQFENQQRAAARLAIVIPAALTVIFVLLLLNFGSARQALLVIANIPFALVGGVLALYVSGQYLSVPASVGFIALLGIAVLNGVVMISHFNERLASGEDISTAVRTGSERRLRPVLMTALITALGMLPLIAATGPGSEIQRPLAIVVSGGLVTATLLTLLLLPRLFERWGRP